MAPGIAAAEANKILEAYGKGTDYSGPAGFFVKLHLGNPGAAGTSNPAAETDRVAATFGSAAAGALTNTGDIEWPAVAATEDISHVSFWDASTAGNFLGSCALAATKSVDAGDDLTIPAGDLDLTLGTVAS